MIDRKAAGRLGACCTEVPTDTPTPPLGAVEPQFDEGGVEITQWPGLLDRFGPGERELSAAPLRIGRLAWAAVRTIEMLYRSRRR